MLGEKLKEARKNLNYTQQQVADITQISRPLYARFELNVCLPNYSDFVKICKILNLPSDVKHYTLCAQPKIACAHAQKCKSSINTYKLSVRLSRRDFCKLTKDNLKKCGFNGLQDFVAIAYHELCNRLKIKICCNVANLQFFIKLSYAYAYEKVY